jgi:copper chaperone
MKKLIILISLFFTSQVFAYDQSAAPAKDMSKAKAIPTSMATPAAKSSVTTLQVEGMTCGACEQSIHSQVTKVPGVTSCKADHKTGMVTIETDGKTTVDKKTLAAAIKKAGFAVK